MKFKLKKIESVSRMEYNGTLHDLTVKDDHSYNIKNVVVHNSACTTRRISGCGVPQLSAIADIRKEVQRYSEVHIIADGGIKTSGDIVKALAAGANSVMVGKMFASCKESPAELISIEGKEFKKYRGQSSYEFQKDNNIFRHKVTPEGESFLLDYSGTIEDTLNILVGGIKSGMSYCGVFTLEELYTNSKFVEITHNSLIESKPHGKL